ncbi:hypothetical protein [Desulfuromonas acetoxidans]|uniref:Uncharacterized protein n=1 Tax=Desulfuromonas acetoxidans (strain DSM 684 / 11070) TaxID=281689 RepID=Q1K4A6_DESA6|nr:hypothetical protein [Desulfuromonas acetoxidans]EAT17197.1 hypothetical protein Dace_3063 [Desulfuromonas acetoxidans DSM 684]MBF0645408.1 hypothetical protein [Desulfuromonas acetoxidans]NVE15013.1 hypothetical protein [Desulfuromonas acetoxidans]
MAFNSGQAFKEMTEAAQASADERWGALEQPFANVMEAQRDALRELATEWFHQEMSDKVLDERLKVLREHFVEALVVDSSAGRAVCDKAVQAALNCFWESLMAGL